MAARRIGGGGRQLEVPGSPRIPRLHEGPGRQAVAHDRARHPRGVPDPHQGPGPGVDIPGEPGGNGVTSASEDDVPATDLTEQLTSGTWAGDWVLDPNRSSLRFRSTSMWGLVRVTGQFSNLRGTGSLGYDGLATGTLESDASSTCTGNQTRRKHLPSADFLHESAHP